MTAIDRVWTHARVATLADTGGPYGIIADGAIAVRGGRIAWVGETAKLPPEARTASVEVHDLGGRWVMPGFIDCHTHLVFGGDRADEFERRLSGESYEEIARTGGGILSTVRATRMTSLDQLLRDAEARAGHLLAEGVTTLEVKSGYGLELDAELRMLRVGRRLGDRLSANVRTTLLGLHAIPPEYAGDRGGYVRLITDEVLPAAHEEGLVDAVDAFCEGIAFTRDECGSLFAVARQLGVPVRIHADQLSDGGGAELAASCGALSADHLEHASESGVRAMGESGTVAVLLPGAFYFLGETRLPPVEAFRSAGVPLALATDANPGSSPLLSILTTLNLGCVIFGLTVEEAIAGVTRNAARALGMESEVGTLEVGKRADMSLWDVDHPRDLAYWVGKNPLAGVVFDGRPVERD